MPAIAKTKIIIDALESFLGADARIAGTEIIPVSNGIQAQRIRVCLPDDTLPEDEGKLYLFPIEEHRFCLQLCYLRYDDASSTNATVSTLRFLPSFFDQYPPEMLVAGQPFMFQQITEQQFPVSAHVQSLLAQLEKASGANPLLLSLQQTETALHLLRSALASLSVPVTDSQVPACRFLAHDSEREKILAARLIIEQHIDQPHTIRELSRKVAMNECYLKKGFKALFGKTIHEYQQELRIAKAKELLQVQGLSVTDVANTLGYSSISHFSTAFKRVTGLKPCELLA